MFESLDFVVRPTRRVENSEWAAVCRKRTATGHASQHVVAEGPAKTSVQLRPTVLELVPISDTTLAALSVNVAKLGSLRLEQLSEISDEGMPQDV